MRLSNHHFLRRTRRSFRCKSSSIIKAVNAAVILAFVIFLYEFSGFQASVKVENGSDGQVEQLTLNESQKVDLDVDPKKGTEKVEENVPAKTKSTYTIQDAPSNGEKSTKSISIETNTILAPNAPDTPKEAPKQLEKWQEYADKENIGPFEHYEGVVMVTKVLWPKDIPLLKQMICLFNAAYNHRAGYYDIVVFTTMSWTQEQIDELAAIAAPATLKVVKDSPDLDKVLAAMTEEEVNFLKDRCGCARNETLTWFHVCREEGYGSVANLGYAWQAVFRAYHLWTEEVLTPYKYMIWLDSDSLPTKSWERDPMKFMIEKDLVLAYDRFNFGRTRGDLFTEKLKLAYNRTVCYVAETEFGYLKTKKCSDGRALIVQAGGFMHITNLDFYRSPSALNFNKIITSYKTPRFSRQWDDQLAVTAPAVMEYPERSWNIAKLMNTTLDIHHNGHLDGGRTNPYGEDYRRFWILYGGKNWDVGREMCKRVVREKG